MGKEAKRLQNKKRLDVFHYVSMVMKKGRGLMRKCHEMRMRDSSESSFLFSILKQKALFFYASP